MRPKKLPPNDDVFESARKELRPLMTSLNAELKVASVDVSAVADWRSDCDSSKNSLS